MATTSITSSLPTATPRVRDNKTTRYAQSLDEAILQARKLSVPEKTQKDTAWFVNQWDNWARWKNSLLSDGQFSAIPAPITSLSREEVVKFMEMFVLVVQKKKRIRVYS